MSLSQFFTPKKTNNRLIPDYDYYIESENIQVVDDDLNDRVSNTHFFTKN